MEAVQHRFRLIAVACWVLSGVYGSAQYIPLPQVSAGESPQVAIYYDGPQEVLSEGPLNARQVLNLLGHFSLRGEIVPLGNYQPGDLARYQAGFFVGTGKYDVF